MRRQNDSGGSTRGLMVYTGLVTFFYDKLNRLTQASEEIEAMDN